VIAGILSKPHPLEDGAFSFRVVEVIGGCYFDHSFYTSLA
jgi:hypothetical protein